MIYCDGRRDSLEFFHEHRDRIGEIKSVTLSDEEIVELLEQEAAKLRQALERYSQVPQQSTVYSNAIEFPREAFFWMLTLEYGIKVNQMKLEWIEDVIQRIKSGQHPSE